MNQYVSQNLNFSAFYMFRFSEPYVDAFDQSRVAKLKAQKYETYRRQKIQIL